VKLKTKHKSSWQRMDITPALPIAEQKFPKFQGIFRIFRGTSKFLFICSTIHSGLVVGKKCTEQIHEVHTFT